MKQRLITISTHWVRVGGSGLEHGGYQSTKRGGRVDEKGMV